jgi:mannose-6-phosphate isomerase-like protein (cupin superfamily)
MRIVLLLILLVSTVVSAQEKPRVLFYPKPIVREYKAPMKAVTRLADVKAKHKAQASWREPVIDDGNSVSFFVQDPVGTKYERRMYPDSAAWFAVLEGEMRFEVEKADGTFDTINATKGSYIFVPERLLHSLEVVGSAPAIRYEVTLGPSSTPVFEKKPATTPKGVEYVPVTLSTGLNPLDVYNEGNGGKPWPYHVNVYELEKRNATKKNFTQEAIRANRARGNFICGYRPSSFPTEKGDRGHLHTDTAEAWLVMLGELRWCSRVMRRPRSSRSKATSSTPCPAPFTLRSSGARRAELPAHEQHDAVAEPFVRREVGGRRSLVGERNDEEVGVVAVVAS